MSSRRWRVGLFVGSLGLAACSTADQLRPTDLVRDETTAIKIGKKVCGDRGGDTDGKWSAKLKAGLWNVEHLYSGGYPKCNWERVKVWADSGKADSCEICVVAT